MAMSGKKGASQRTSDLIQRLDALRKDASKTVGFRVDIDTYNKIVEEAARQGMKPSQLVRSWVLQRLYKD